MYFVGLLVTVGLKYSYVLCYVFFWVCVFQEIKLKSSNIYNNIYKCWHGTFISYVFEWLMYLYEVYLKGGTGTYLGLQGTETNF